MKKFYDMQATEGSYGNTSNKLQTVYIKAESTDKVLNTFALTKIGDKSFVYFISKHEGYFFTEEKLLLIINEAYEAGILHNELSNSFDNPKGRYLSHIKETLL